MGHGVGQRRDTVGNDEPGVVGTGSAKLRAEAGEVVAASFGHWTID